MITTNRKRQTYAAVLNHFGEKMSDGRMTKPSAGNIYRLREAIRYSQKLGRPLTDDEMKLFEVVPEEEYK